MAGNEPKRLNSWSGPFRIVSIYAAVGVLYILFSDTLLETAVKDPALLTRISILKGVLYVLVTAALLFLLIDRYVAKIRRHEEELRESRERLLQSHKMEAVGRLAGGVAHDFNNLLTVITGFGELLLSRMGEGDPCRREAEEILKAGNRAAVLTRQLLAFSRRQILQPEIVDLNRIVRDLETMLGRLIGENMELDVRLDDGLGRVKVDPGQMEQVVVNLVVNARDAMPGGGKVSIRTGNADAEGGAAWGGGIVPDGSYCLLEVEDTGVGMDRQTIASIFEPFFTTKEKGKGTGLGLATVYGIVKQSGGYILVDSAPGKGSTFRICLPRVEEPAAGPAAEPASEPATGPTRSGSGPGTTPRST